MGRNGQYQSRSVRTRQIGKIGQNVGIGHVSPNLDILGHSGEYVGLSCLVGQRGQAMTNYVGADVIRLIGVTHPDEITTDSDYQIGHITMKVGNKVRIEWIDRYRVRNNITFEFTTQITKLDKETFWLKNDNSSKLSNTTNSGTQVKSDVAQDSDKAPETDEVVAKPRIRRTPTKSVKA